MQTLPADRQKESASPIDSARSAQRALAAAFASFTQTAGALETTYTKLQAEVGRLRHELESKNRSLAQSLEENRRMRTYLAGIVEGLPCGVLVFDRQRKLRMINPAASRLLGTGNESVLSAETSVPHMLGALLDPLPKEEFCGEQEWAVQGPQGERAIGVTRANLQAGEPGNDSILILRDLTDAKQLERERELTRRTQALAEVATLLAHEIRNPLGSLELFAGLLADALADQPEVRPWITHVQAGLRSLAATVNNVLQFHSQPPAELVPVDLVRLAGQTVDFLRPLAQQKEMRIAWSAPRAAVSILADPSRLQQAFFNLALNAFRAMKAGGVLTITVDRSEAGGRPSVAVAFVDQGTGIPAENWERIFEPGFSTQCGSPGLGLAVTRKVVEQHSGAIRVESQEGRGTAFTLTFPAAASEAIG